MCVGTNECMCECVILTYTLYTDKIYDGKINRATRTYTRMTEARTGENLEERQNIKRERFTEKAVGYCHVKFKRDVCQELRKSSGKKNNRISGRITKLCNL